MKRLWNLVLLLAVLYAVLCLLAWWLQAKLVYFPGAVPERSPANLGLVFDDLRLETQDGMVIHAWHLPARDARGVILFSHGNAGSIDHRLESATTFLEMGWSVLLYDYRGYGHSTGSPDEAGTYLDAEAAYDWLVGAGGYRSERVLAYGESLGGAVTIELATRRKLSGVVVESTFTSLVDVGAGHYPWLPVRLLSRSRYDSGSKVGALGVPLLVIHSPDDRIVPVEYGRALFEAAAEPKRWLATQLGHNDGGFQLRHEWQAAVAEFLKEAVQ